MLFKKKAISPSLSLSSLFSIIRPISHFLCPLSLQSPPLPHAMASFARSNGNGGCTNNMPPPSVGILLAFSFLEVGPSGDLYHLVPLTTASTPNTPLSSSLFLSLPTTTSGHLQHLSSDCIESGERHLMRKFV